ncbi:hypothetical protein [Pseudoalteromonas rubra]|uniref:Uncharacterized protein n=1 Tax=Pseudoalteromonas rubra TaxID=43658 RepID=A0A0U3HMN4_9GAMM|nr:hypothetical protein [Pseudoalteromonas rubra]ALU42184.1 hypothetical protein AT705_04070 [Pseudoalteromonas rubra]
MDSGYWFKSTKFEIEKSEDEETNPGCYGKQLALWLSDEFTKLGYETDVIPEDWGWCVMCESNGYLLWLGCGSMQDEESLENYQEGKPPKGTEVVWHTFSVIEVPFFNFKVLIQKWFGKLDLKAPLMKIDSELQNVLSSEVKIELCEEP